MQAEAWEQIGRWANTVEARLADIEGRLKHLETGELPPTNPDPSPDSLRPVPFTFPPLIMNRGSWDDADYTRGHGVVSGKLQVTIGQKAQGEKRVCRHDFGLQDPAEPVGRGGFLREPIGVRRRYELRITLPERYDARGEVCNLLQLHTHSAKAPPYYSFMLWTTSSRHRHNSPNGDRIDYNVQPFKHGHTYHVVIEAVWSKKADGVLRVWEDGEEVIDYTGPTFRAEEEKAAYLLFGPYYPSAVDAFSNTVIFSDLRIGSV